MTAVREARRTKHVPKRTCVGCRKVTAKRDLIRVVRTDEGSVGVDPTGKQPGRGAYLCSDVECWERALRKGGLGHALKFTLTLQHREKLMALAATLLPSGAQEVR